MVVRRPQLTVRQLVELLLKEDQDVLVHSEGCDCDGRVAGVEKYAADGSIILSRTDGAYR